MKFTATDDQIREMCALACAASIPVGMGFLHYNREDRYSGVKFDIEDGAYLDYVDGRMVKLTIHKRPNDVWEIPRDARADYQSWVRMYPTNRALAEAAGVTNFIE